MLLAGLLTAALGDDALGRARDLAVVDPPTDQLEVVAPTSLRPFVAAVLASQAPGGAGRPVLAVTATTREAEDLAAALADLIPAEQVAVYPAWETLPHERLSPRSDTVGRRLGVLRRLAYPDSGPAQLRAVVAPVRSVLQPQLKRLGELEPIELHPGDTADLNEIVHRLTDIAYARADLVTKRGEFAVRGGILDVFPPTDEHPVRVEFWGDEIEEIRTFAVADQRTLAPVDRLWAPPCRELLLTDAVRARARTLSEQHPALSEMLDKLAEGIPVEGMESLAPALLDGADSLELLQHCMPPGTHVLLCDPERIRTRAHDLVRTSEEFLEASWAAAAAGGKAPIDLGAAAFRSLGEVRTVAAQLGQPWWSLSPFGPDANASSPHSPRRGPLGVDQGNISDITGDETYGLPLINEGGGGGEGDGDAESIVLAAQAVPAYHGETGRVVDDLKRWSAEGWQIALIFEGHGPAQRAAEVLRDGGLGVRLAEQLDAPPEPGEIAVATGNLAYGFLDEGARLAIITGNDISGGRGASTKDMRRMPSRRRNTIDPLELRAGDHVVHEQHGIGRYVEMVQRTVNGADREYLVIEYAPGKRGQPGDRLFMPTDSLDQLSRYVGGENPTLHKMGGSMQSYRAEAAHDPGADARVLYDLEEVDVLDERESRAHGEAEDRGIDEEADAVRADQRDDDETLQELLDDRRDVAREGGRSRCRAESSVAGVHEIAAPRDRRAARDDRDDGGELHELVAVEVEQRREEASPPAAGPPARARHGDRKRHSLGALHDLERDHPLGARALAALEADGIARPTASCRTSAGR